MESVHEDEARVKYQSIIEDTDTSQRKTKIVCTLGPACDTVEKLTEMLDAGMDISRLNFSHGDHKTHGETVDNLKKALEERKGSTCAILLDTKGPEIRTGLMRDNEAVEFETGQEIDILTDYELEGDNTRLTCNYKSLPTTVKPGDNILIADGALSCEVIECFEDSIKVRCKNGATIGEKKNMNLPGCKVDLPTLTEQDEKDIVDFGLKRGVDIIAASFVRTSDDIKYIREVLGPKGAHVKIIAKIEN